MANPEQLRDLAERCRGLARQMLDDELRKKLLDLAGEFEEEAEAQEQGRPADRRPGN